MPLYELRRGGRAVERVRTVTGRFEDTRLGLMVLERDRTGEVDGWHLVDEPAESRPAEADTGG